MNAVMNVPLFAGLPAEEVDGLLRVCEPVSFADGNALMRQGQPADGAFIVQTGHTECRTALPGGGEAVVASLGPGSVIGEMALLDRGMRTATVVARGPVSGLYIGRDAFRLLLAQRARAAFTIRNRITRTLCQRLRELNQRIVEADDTTRADASPAPDTALMSNVRFGAGSFEWRRFLPLLAAFEGFGPDSIAQFAARATCVEIPRGQVLFDQDAPCTSAFVVVRGALQIDRGVGTRLMRIGILGPGRLCGILAMIEDRPHSMRATARERTTLAAVSKADFDALFTGDELVATKFQDAINRELLGSIARTNNHLTRLVSQAQIRGLAAQRAGAERLQRELAVIDCTDA
jgi:CRP-like cAMP-binding protein